MGYYGDGSGNGFSEVRAPRRVKRMDTMPDLSEEGK